MNDSAGSTSEDLPSHPETHLSDTEATRITQDEVKPALQEFSTALGMARPVPLDRLALLLEHMIKDQRSSDSVLIADQMRLDRWEDALSENESFKLIAERMTAFLTTEDGTRLYNFFVKIFAKTTDTMFQSADSRNTPTDAG